jgi:hypothetical protein
VIWPHDAQHPLVSMHGADPVFWMSVAQLAIFGTLSVLAFVQRRRVARRNAHCPNDSMSATTARQSSTAAGPSMPAVSHTPNVVALGTRAGLPNLRPKTELTSASASAFLKVKERSAAMCVSGLPELRCRP